MNDKSQDTPGCKSRIIGIAIAFVGLIAVNLLINGGIRGCNRAQYARQYQEIDDLKPKLEALKTSIAQREQDLTMRSAIIETENWELDRMEKKLKEAEKKYPGLKMPAAKAKEFNDLVDTFNTKIQLNNSRIAEFESDKSTYDSEVKEANSYIERMNALGLEIGSIPTVGVGVRARRR